MAKVAAAIEQAAGPKLVDESLWWDISFVDLLTELESINSPASAQTVASKIKDHNHCFLNLLGFFKHPNSESRSAVNGNQMIIGCHSIDLSSELREIALQLTSYLVLDEVQMYLLLCRIVKSNSTVNLRDFDSVLQVTGTCYFLERQCLLKCMLQILMHKLTNGNGMLDAIKEQASSLLNDGLEERTFEALKNLLSAERPATLDIQYADLWAQETLIEQSLSMDILFLLYYEPQHMCTVAEWNKVYSIFVDIISGSSNIEQLLVSEASQNYALHIRFQATLILIECFDLENLLCMLSNEVPFRGSHGFSFEDLQEIEYSISNLSSLKHSESSPVVFAWAIFIYVVSMLPTTDEAFILDINYLAYIRQAFGDGVLNAIYNMLQSSAFQNMDLQGQLTGYKSVLKALTSGFFAAYDVNNQEESVLDMILDIVCKIYCGQETLCLEFWDSESIIDRPMRNFLSMLMSYFPFNILRVVKFLSAVCEGTWPAGCIYEFLCRRTNMTTLVHSQNVSVDTQKPEKVAAHVTLQLPGVEALVVPAGCVGNVVRSLNDGVMLVCWEIAYSPLLVILLRLRQEIINGKVYEEIIRILELLNRMLSFNKETTLKILHINGSVMVGGIQSESTISIDVPAVFCTLVNNLERTCTDSNGLALTIDILCKLSDCVPARVVPELLQIPLFESQAVHDKSDGFLLVDGLARFLFVDGDHCIGNYNFIICYIGLCNQFVKKGGRRSLIDTLVTHAVRYILVNHGNWKYNLRYQRWQIATKVFELIQNGICCNTGEQPEDMKNCLMEIMLYDSAVYGVVLQIICNNAEFVKEPYLSRLVDTQEVEWVQRSVYSALTLIVTVLDVLVSEDTMEDHVGTTPLEQNILQHSTSNLFMSHIISLLSCAHNDSLQVHVAQLVSKLCIIAQRLRPHPVSLEIFIVNSKQRKQLNSIVSTVLSEECAEERATLNFKRVSAYMNLLTCAALYQPSFSEVMLVGQESPTQPHMNAGKKACDGAEAVGVKEGDEKAADCEACNVIELLYKCVRKSENLMTRQPYTFSKILHLLDAVWKEGTLYVRVLDKLHNCEMFWKSLSSCISAFTSNSISSYGTLKNEDISDMALKYQCQSLVLDIMAQQLFYKRQFIQAEKSFQKSAVALSTTLASRLKEESKEFPIKNLFLKYGDDGCMENTLAGWSKNNEICQINSHLASCIIDKALFVNIKGITSAFIVGLMHKILSGDSIGLSLTLTEQIHLLAQRLLKHPAFLELLEQYRRLGYSDSHGKELQAFIINDLYYHLQGELEGRKMPQGPFQRLCDYLTEMELDSILNRRGVCTKFSHHMNHDEYIYDTRELERKMGFEWLLISDNKAFTSIAEKMVQSLVCINKMAHLADSQLKALKAWIDLLAVSMSHSKKVTADQEPMQDAIFTDESISLCVDDLCNYVVTSVQMLEACNEPVLYFSNILKLQVQLLLCFLGWMYHRRTISKAQHWPLYAKVVKTTLTCLNSLVITRPRGFEKLAALLLAAILTVLESIRFQNKKDCRDGSKKIDGQGSGDAFVDVSLACLGFLPSLCSFVENKCLLHLSLATIDSLLKGFLEPNAWLPVLQKHFPVSIVIGQLQSDTWKDSASVVLSLCLSLAQVKGGADMLNHAGFFSCLLAFSRTLHGEFALDPRSKQASFSCWHTWGASDGLWGLGIAIVTAMLISNGENSVDASILDNAVTFFLSEKSYILSKICPQEIIFDKNAKNRLKPLKLQCSFLALRETEYCITLMFQLARHRVRWLNIIRDTDSRLREVSVHLLAFISRGGGYSSENRKGNMILQCPPITKDEITANERPSITNCKIGWFGILVQSTLLSTRCPASQQHGHAEQSTSFDKGSSESDDVTASSTEFTDLVAMQLYKIAFLVLSLLCMQAQAAVKNMDETGTIDFVHFPELPVPEILHNLQDQVLDIMVDLCNGKKANLEKHEVRSLCILLLRVMEKALCVEVCVRRICGISPVSVREDTLQTKYEALLSAIKDLQFLEVPLLSLRPIIALLYPGLS